MGTRGLVAIKSKSIFIGIANNFDSHISELGTLVKTFIIKLNVENGWNRFKQNLNQLEIARVKYEPKSGFSVMFSERGNVRIESVKSREDLEDSEFLYRIYQNEMTIINNEVDFGEDGLFCEYGYIINLDNNMFEFYIGNKPNFLSNKKGLFQDNISHKFKDNSVYYSIQKISEYPLNNLPENLIEDKLHDDFIKLKKNRNKGSE